MVRWSFFRNFAAMIQELPRYENVEDYYNEPLLEYIVKVTEKEWPYHRNSQNGHSTIPITFCKRYISGKIKMLEIIRDRFMEANEVKASLGAFGLDANKLFYLCLLFKDYSEGQTIDSAKENPTHREELEMLVNELSRMTPNPPKDFKLRIMLKGPARRIYTDEPLLSDNIIQTDNLGEITVKVGGGRKKTIRDGQTLFLIKEALSQFLHASSHDSPYLNNAPLRPSKTSDLPQIYRVALFYQYMKRFLTPYTNQRTAEASVDKTFFISRLIYVFALSNDKRYYDKTVTESNSKKSFLKSNLSHYVNIKIPVDNKYYPRK